MVKGHQTWSMPPIADLSFCLKSVLLLYFTCATYLYDAINLFLLPFAFQNLLLIAQERQLAIIHQPLQNTWKWPGKEADVKVWSEADKAMQVIETVNFGSFEQLSVTPFCGKIKETETLLLCLFPQEERLGFVFSFYERSLKYTRTKSSVLQEFEFANLIFAF